MKKEHLVQVMMHDERWVAIELNGKVTFKRDGDVIGSARWKQDQFIDNSALLPDDVCEALEQKIKERMDAHWDE